MGHTLTGMLALAAVLLILLARRCEGSARHRGCARRCASRSGTTPAGNNAPPQHGAARGDSYARSSAGVHDSW